MIPHYNVLSDSEINMIHEGALAVLENTGLVINHPFALERLADAGANVDFNEKRVRIPRDLVGTCLEKAPNKFVCGGQTPGFDFTMDFESTKIRTGGGSIYVMDWEKGEQRPLTYQDNADFARLTDALEKAQDRMGGRLSNLLVTQDTNNAGTFTISTSQMNQSLVKEVLTAAMPDATISEPQVDEIVNNAILILDYVNELRRKGMHLTDALIEACPAKLRPILMSSIAIILGMVPMAVGMGDAGREMRQPMGVVSIGGLVVSTLLTLVVIPAVYNLLAARKKQAANQ